MHNEGVVKKHSEFKGGLINQKIKQTRSVKAGKKAYTELVCFFTAPSVLLGFYWGFFALMPRGHRPLTYRAKIPHQL